ncbi:hypothetical protein L1987_58509 [Smallanthus sonchifolius]|uniref:Uncharacterized protein n=1 Tax=Smallanthus sonchifolius TaxID=185202 RepID=A0ACB9DGB0_9ASTR|nr:hypothetical protein L1987_58509 [Smallanthus sonchifolius]
MEQDGVKLTNLPTDVLRLIIMYLAMSNGGASNLAKVIAVCEAFNKFSNDREILKVTNFDNMEQYYLNDTFWNEDGLLAKCVTVGNESTRQIIQQIPFLLLGMEEV